MIKKILSFIGIVLICIIAFILLRPVFVDKEIDEAFPGAIDSAKDALHEGMQKVMPQVQLPDPEELEKMTEEAKKSIERSIIEKMAEFDPVIVEEDMDMTEEPQVIAQGNFVDADNFHKGSGDATIYQLPGEDHVLRLENFEVTNGPDLFVYLVKDANNVKSDFVDLGRLKGNKGNQNYEIPGDVNVGEYEAVVIWCRAFSVLFSTATFN